MLTSVKTTLESRSGCASLLLRVMVIIIISIKNKRKSEHFTLCNYKELTWKMSRWSRNYDSLNIIIISNWTRITHKKTLEHLANFFSLQICNTMTHLFTSKTYQCDTQLTSSSVFSWIVFGKKISKMYRAK